MSIYQSENIYKQKNFLKKKIITSTTHMANIYHNRNQNKILKSYQRSIDKIKLDDKISICSLNEEQSYTKTQNKYQSYQNLNRSMKESEHEGKSRKSSMDLRDSIKVMKKHALEKQKKRIGSLTSLRSINMNESLLQNYKETLKVQKRQDLLKELTQENKRLQNQQQILKNQINFMKCNKIYEEWKKLYKQNINLKENSQRNLVKKVLAAKKNAKKNQDISEREMSYYFSEDEKKCEIVLQRLFQKLLKQKQQLEKNPDNYLNQKYTEEINKKKIELRIYQILKCQLNNNYFQFQIFCKNRNNKNLIYCFNLLEVFVLSYQIHYIIMRPNQGYPPHGYPPNQGYPPQGMPNQGYPPQGYPPQGMPNQGHPPQGYPPHGQMPPQGYPNQGYPPQGYPPQGQMPPQGYPNQPGMMPYQNQNFQNYQMHTYGITRNHIQQHAEQLFRKYDHDRSGELQMHELIPLLNEFCAVSNIGQINPRDAQYMMYLFDWDRSGAISFRELKMMLKMLGGIKKYDKMGIMNKFKNGKKGKKEKSMKKKGLKKIIDYM